ncbi:damage-inducible protein CinA [Streptococcus infantis]|uniref:damage-inducible protein CinA n=1 Tax=Streptococcus infantis TaxID=68892 RepID=UPI0039C261D9
MNVYGRLEDEPTPTWTGSQGAPVENEEQLEVETRQPAHLPFFNILILSTLVVLVSVILPYLLGLLSPEQAQDFYNGWAMHQSGDIYSDYFGTSGLLYYFLQYLTKGSILFAAFNWLALVGAGFFLFHSAYNLTEQNKQSQQVLTVFYILTAAFSFGGGYATILALPFLFYALSIVTAYLAEPDHDKGFVRIGISLALAFFFAPLVTTLFAFVLLFAVTAFNVSRNNLNHGLYQFFAAGLGFSIFFYPIGYYTAYKGSFGNAISQILYPVDSLNFMSNPGLLDNILFYGLLAIALGVLTLAFTGLFQSKPLKQSVLSVFAAIAVVLVLALEVFSTDLIHGSRMVEFLPFMTILLLTRIRTWELEGANRRRRRREETSPWGTFVKGNAYLPIFALVYLFLAPVVSRYLLHAEQYKERTSIEAKIKSETQATDRIYVWDNLTSSYKASERLSASQLLSPRLHTGIDTNRTKLINDLRDNQPKMIVVNTKTTLWTEVEQLLAENYQAVQGEFKDFKLYKLK